MTSRQETAPAATPSPARARRRLPLLLLAAPLLLLAGYAGLLWWMGGQMRAALDQWAAQRRAEGWVVDYATPTRRPDPLAATLRLPEVRLESGGTAWRAAAVQASLSPFSPGRLRLRAEGAQSLALAGGAPMPLQTGTLEAEVTLPDARAASLWLRDAALGSAAGPLRLEEGRLDLESAAGPDGTGLSLRLRGLLPPGTPVLGPRLEEATLQARLHGLPSAPGGAALARWRDAGGRLEVLGMTLRWGAMAASAAATLALDSTLQPAGAGTLRVANPVAVLDALGTAGAVPARDLSMARRFLPLLARPDAGGVPVVELPVALENRTLSVARLPLLRLPAVEW